MGWLLLPISVKTERISIIERGGDSGCRPSVMGADGDRAKTTHNKRPLASCGRDLDAHLIR